MPKFETILEKRENRINDALELFTTGFDKIEQNIYKRLDQVLKKTTISFGKLSNDEYSRKLISNLDQTIREALQESGYGNKVNQLITTYDFIASDNIELHKALNKEKVSEKLVNSIKQLEVNNTIDNLLNAGIYKDFISPVRQALYRHIVLGTSLHDAEETIKNIVLSEPDKDSSILKYAKQVSQDAIYQYDGSINKAIEEELELDAYLYVGSLVKDSRAQCAYWVGKQILKKDKQLEKEIEKAQKNRLFNNKKASGMNLDTTIETFVIYRGGYRCRHKALPTRYENFT